MGKLQGIIETLNKSIPVSASAEIEQSYYQLLSDDTFALTTVRRDVAGGRMQEHKVLVQGSESTIMTYIERKLGLPTTPKAKNPAPAAPEVGAAKDVD